MTNFEFYKDKILEIGSIGEIALMSDGKVIECLNSKCNTCEFDKGDCLEAKTKWLYKEHVEKPKPAKLTKKERKFCEFLETGYIARDENGNLGYYDRKPGKSSHDNCWTSGFGWSRIDNCELIYDVNFDFIKWEDTEPWSVEELLKLEVEE